MLKKTAFYNKHVDFGGKIVPFAGFEMPIQYKGITQEVKRVRGTVGVFDVAHMGRLEVRGSKALDFINNISTNDAGTLAPFQVQYSAMCYPEGGIVDDILVYRQEEGKWLIVVNAANFQKDLDWMNSHKIPGMELIDLSDEMTQLAIQGPNTEAVLQPMVDIDLSKMKYYWGGYGKILGTPSFIARTGYTGEDGFEIYFPFAKAHEVWDKLMELGKKFNIEPIGLGARDILRLEMKYCLYGNDIDKDTTPLEAGLGWITKLNKPNFIGKDVLVKQKAAGIKRKLSAFEMTGAGIPRHLYEIKSPTGDAIGVVTSGNFSPSISKGVGLGYVKTEFSNIGTKIMIDCRGKLEEAQIITPPFYKNASHK